MRFLNQQNPKAVKLPTLGNYKNLISLELDPHQLMNIPKQQKFEYFNKIKKQANYFLLSVFRALEQKKYTLAKDILIYIADSCSCIHPPDKESEELMQICCEELAQIMKVQEWISEKKMTKKIEGWGHGERKLELFVMRYNKFSGEFQCDDKEKKIINPEVLFYLSKLNTILFGEQTTENTHSMLAMLKLYSIEIILVFLLILLLVLVQMTSLKKSLFQLSESSFNIPALIVGAGFFIPLFVIFFKPPLTKNSNFFEKKLTEEIKKINQECHRNNNKIVFMLPEGMELNVKVQHQFDEILENDENGTVGRVKLDLERIKKRVSHFCLKSKVKQIN